MVKSKIEEVQLRIDDEGLDFKIIEYNGTKRNSLFIHSECGRVSKTRLPHLLNRRKCHFCHHSKRDIEKFQTESNRKHNNEYEILEFINGNKPVKIKHLVCGEVFDQTGHRHLRGDRCFKCYGSKKYTKDDIIKISKEKWGDDYEILSQNVDYGKRATIKHKCGNVYDQYIYQHLLKGGCRYCGGNAKHTIESVQDKSNKIHNNEYRILTDPKGSFSKVKILHIFCGREFEQSVTDHLGGCGCSFCNLSKGERLIELFLIEENINYIKQKTFENCKFRNKLKFDFYLTDYNFCIEYDGHQHFKPVRFFGGRKSFELQKIKDNIKNEFCLNSSIPLVRFRYDDSIETIKEKLFIMIRKQQN